MNGFVCLFPLPQTSDSQAVLISCAWHREKAQLSCRAEPREPLQGTWQQLLSAQLRLHGETTFPPSLAQQQDLCPQPQSAEAQLCECIQILAFPFRCSQRANRGETDPLVRRRNTSSVPLLRVDFKSQCDHLLLFMKS